MSGAEIRSPQWKIAGPFRYGQALPPVIGDVATKTLKSTATVEFSGDGRRGARAAARPRVAALTYLCVPGLKPR